MPEQYIDLCVAVMYYSIPAMAIIGLLAIVIVLIYDWRHRYE